MEKFFKRILSILILVATLLSPISILIPEKSLAVAATENWSSWILSSGSTTDPLSLEGYNGRMYLAVKGNGYPYHIWVRSTEDGVFDEDEGEGWLKPGGQTSRQVSLAEFDSKLYMAVRGGDSRIYTRSMNASAEWDATWNEDGGKTTNTIAMDNYNGKLFQAVRGNGSNRIYYRSSADGEFDGGTGEEWQLMSGQTNDDIALEVFDSKLYMSVHGTTGNIYTRYTSDGVNWSEWQQAPGNSVSPLALESHAGKLYQSARGSTGRIFLRKSTNGIDWTEWQEMGGATPNRIGMKSFNGTLYLYVRSSSGRIYFKETRVLSTFTGTYFNVSFDYDADRLGVANSGVRLEPAPNEDIYFGHLHILSGGINMEPNRNYAYDLDFKTIYRLNVQTKDGVEEELTIEEATNYEIGFTGYLVFADTEHGEDSFFMEGKAYDIDTAYYQASQLEVIMNSFSWNN